MTPTPVFLPGHGLRSLASCSQRDGKESDTTERLTLSLSQVALLTNKDMGMYTEEFSR